MTPAQTGILFGMLAAILFLLINSGSVDKRLSDLEAKIK